MCTGLELAALFAAATTTQAVMSHQQEVQQGRAQNQAKAAADKNAEQSLEAQNKANARGPDVGSLLSSNLAAGKNAGGSTLLGGT